jgi:hypothetical protein
MHGASLDMASYIKRFPYPHPSDKPNPWDKPNRIQPNPTVLQVLSALSLAFFFAPDDREAFLHCLAEIMFAQPPRTITNIFKVRRATCG